MARRKGFEPLTFWSVVREYTYYSALCFVIISLHIDIMKRKLHIIYYILFCSFLLFDVEFVQIVTLKSLFWPVVTL